MSSPFKLSSLFKSGIVALFFVGLLSVGVFDAALARPGGGGHGGGFRGGGGFHGGGFHGGGFRGGGFHGGGFHGMRMGGGGRHFGGRSGFAPRSFARPGFHGGRSFANRSYGGRAARVNASRGPGRNLAAASVSRSRNLNAAQNSRAIRSALNNRSVNRAFNNRNALRNPGTRALVTTRLATAGWHGRNGWWRHPHGGYGWVGPVFWPFAFYDIYGYSLWGYGYDTAFWDYGYPDIYAGLFAPYGYDDLIGYSGYLRGARAGRDSYASVNPNEGSQTSLTQMCGEDSRDIAGLPIDAIQKAIQPDDAQRAALDDLANASIKAGASIKAACPTEVALTAPRRLAVMQQRIEAMIAAVNGVQPPLEKFYGLLNDEQKARFNGLVAKPRPVRAGRTATASAGACGATQPGLTEWPSEAIEQSVKPTDDQRKGLADLQAAANKASDMLRASCEPDNAATPPARLAAVGKRLGTMLDAVKTVRSAVDSFYTSLSDEQKANFDAIGPKRMGALDQDEGAPSARGRRHAGSMEHMIRRMMSFVR